MERCIFGQLGKQGTKRSNKLCTYIHTYIHTCQVVSGKEINKIFQLKVFQSRSIL